MSNEQDVTIMLTTIEAAKILGVDPSRVRQLARAGTMPYIERGGVYFFTQAALDAARQRNTKPGPKRKEKV